jgi:putative membrane protein
MHSPKLIREADFSPKIETYILLYVGLILLLTVIGIPLLLIWLLGFGKYISSRYYENLKCQLTDRHLIFSKGVFFKVEKTIPLENIQDLTFVQNPILNLLDLRILKIETAGGGHSHESDMKLIGITDSEGFKQDVLNQREEVRMKTERIQNSELDTNETLEVLKEIRDLLKKDK